MTKLEAIRIAKTHLDVMNRNNSDSDKMSWILSKCVEYNRGFYFDYKFELINPDENLAFGGAPGFLVLKVNSSVLDLSWSELNELQ